MKQFKVDILGSTVIFIQHIKKTGFDDPPEESYEILSITPDLPQDTNIEFLIWENMKNWKPA